MSINGMSTYIMSTTEDVKETTVSSDIAFLPGGVGPVVRAISGLGRTKKKWKPKVVSDDQDYLVLFEDELSIRVPQESWDSFLEAVGNRVPVFKGIGINDSVEIDITPFMVEMIGEESRKLLRDCRLAFRTLIREQTAIIESVSYSSHLWDKEFGYSKCLEESKILLRRGSFNEDLQKLFAELEEVYRDDVGGLQMLLEALRNRSSLEGFEVFENYTYLFGKVVSSDVSGVGVVFEAVVDMNFKSSVCIKTKSSEIISEVSKAAPVIIKGDGFSLRGRGFNPQFLSEFHELVERLSEEGELS